MNYSIIYKNLDVLLSEMVVQHQMHHKLYKRRADLQRKIYKKIRRESALTNKIRRES